MAEMVAPVSPSFVELFIVPVILLVVTCAKVSNGSSIAVKTATKILFVNIEFVFFRDKERKYVINYFNILLTKHYLERAVSTVVLLHVVEFLYQEFIHLVYIHFRNML